MKGDTQKSKWFNKKRHCGKVVLKNSVLTGQMAVITQYSVLSEETEKQNASKVNTESDGKAEIITYIKAKRTTHCGAHSIPGSRKAQLPCWWSRG